MRHAGDMPAKVLRAPGCSATRVMHNFDPWQYACGAPEHTDTPADVCVFKVHKISFVKASNLRVNLGWKHHKHASDPINNDRLVAVELVIGCRALAAHATQYAMQDAA